MGLVCRLDIYGITRSYEMVERMPEERTVKKVFENISERETSVGKPRKRWLDDAENDLKKEVIRGWRKIVRGGDAWKLILKGIKVLHGPWASGEEKRKELCGIHGVAGTVRVVEYELLVVGVCS